MNNPELLLPVGTRDMLESAINNGADAVYYGVPHWNARGRTEDFSFEDVEEMIRYARLRGVKTYLAMNILIFEREIQDLPEFLERLIALKPDAFIIQDIGLARLIKAISPEQECEYANDACEFRSREPGQEHRIFKSSFGTRTFG